MNKKVLKHLVVLVVSTALLAFLPVSGMIGFAVQSALTLGMIYAVAAIGLDIFMGYAGQLSFGHFGFVATGAYISTLVQNEFGLNGWLALPVAVVGTGVIALLLGIPMVRLPEVGSSLVSFFFAFIVVTLLGGSLLIDITNGSTGLLVPTLEVGGGTLADAQWSYFAALIVLVAALVVSLLLVNSRFGKMLHLVRENPTVATSLGAHVNRAKLSVFVYSAAWCAVSGFLYAQTLGILVPEGFTPFQSIYLAMMVVLGGLGTVYGPVLGALFYALMTELSFEAGATAGIILAGIILVVLVVMPGGITGLVARVVAMLRPGATAPEVATAQQDPVFEPAGVSRERAAGRPPEATDPVLEVKGLGVSFGGVRAIDEASISVAAGSIHGIVGPNGAGKTTLLNAICGYIDYDGSVVLGGDEDLGRLHPSQLRGLGVARAFQHPALAGSLTVRENVALGLFGDRSGASGAVVDQLLHLTGVPERTWGQRADTLSLAQAKMVDVARAGVSRPRVLLLDEPTAGLESDEMAAMTRVIATLAERGAAIVIISHHIGFLQGLADTVSVFDFGRLVTSGPFDEVFGREDVRNAFMGASNV